MGDPSSVTVLAGIKQRARIIKRETLTLYLAAQHPRTPWYAKMLALAIAGYALSPIDLIPDFIPVLGYLDDVILLPLGIALAMRLVPDALLLRCRPQAEAMAGQRVSLKGRWIMAGVFVLIWGLLMWGAIRAIAD